MIKHKQNRPRIDDNNNEATVVLGKFIAFLSTMMSTAEDKESLGKQNCVRKEQLGQQLRGVSYYLGGTTGTFPVTGGLSICPRFFFGFTINNINMPTTSNINRNMIRLFVPFF